MMGLTHRERRPPTRGLLPSQRNSGAAAARGPRALPPASPTPWPRPGALGVARVGQGLPGARDPAAPPALPDGWGQSWTVAAWTRRPRRTGRVTGGDGAPTPPENCLSSEPGNSKVNGANQAAAGQRSQVPRSSLDFQTWQQHSRTDTLTHSKLCSGSIISFSLKK